MMVRNWSPLPAAGIKDFVEGCTLHTSRRMVITARGGVGNFVEGCALHTSHTTRFQAPLPR